MAADKSNFVTAVELRDMMEKVVERNPEALVMVSMDNRSGYLVLDRVYDELDSDGDARFDIRDYDTGKKVEVLETEDLYYQS